MRLALPTPDTDFTRDALGSLHLQHVRRDAGHHPCDAPRRVCPRAGTFGHLTSSSSAAVHSVQHFEKICGFERQAEPSASWCSMADPSIAGAYAESAGIGSTLVPHAPSTCRKKNEVWGLAWNSNDPIGFPGLAYCLGGRSVYWGGWSPRLSIPNPQSARGRRRCFMTTSKRLPDGSKGYFGQSKPINLRYCNE